VERLIEEREKEKASCETALCEPDVLRDAEAARTLKKKLSEIEAELADGYRRWEHLTEELSAPEENG